MRTESGVLLFSVKAKLEKSIPVKSYFFLLIVLDDQCFHFVCFRITKANIVLKQTKKRKCFTISY